MNPAIIKKYEKENNKEEKPDNIFSMGLGQTENDPPDLQFDLIPPELREAINKINRIDTDKLDNAIDKINRIDIDKLNNIMIKIEKMLGNGNGQTQDSGIISFLTGNSTWIILIIAAIAVYFIFFKDK